MSYSDDYGAPEDHDEIEASRAPLMEHLIELRGRLIVCAAALVVGFGVCFAFVTQIYVFLLEPFKRAAGLMAVQQAHGGHVGSFDLLLTVIGLKAAPHGQIPQLIFTEPLEFFFTKVKLAGFGAIVLTFPILAFQLYRFVAPGLYKREKRAFLPFLLASPVLFTLGASLVYFIMLPFVLWFSLNQQITGDALGLGPAVAQGHRNISPWSPPCCWPLVCASSCRWSWRCSGWPGWSIPRCCARVVATPSSASLSSPPS